MLSTESTALLGDFVVKERPKMKVIVGFWEGTNPPEWFWAVYARNGRRIALSQNCYSTKSHAVRAANRFIEDMRFAAILILEQD